MKGVDITKYEEGLQAAKDVVQAEQEIQRLVNEKGFNSD